MIRKVGIIGSTGLIGTALKIKLQNFEIVSIPGKSLYDPAELIADRLKGINVIINLAGYPVNGRWTRGRKELIYKSRINLTENLFNAVKLMEIKPVQIINASAVGIYRENIICDETCSEYADNPLARIVIEWEKRALKFNELSVKVAIIRTGIVLSKSGGAYKVLRRIIKSGLGGIISSGRQGFSFILLEDAVRAIEWILNKQIKGVVNLVCPEPVDNKTFIKAVASKLNRPAFFSLPAFVIRCIMGEGGTILLEGQKVIPSVLLKNNFKFVGNNLKTCLEILEK